MAEKSMSKFPQYLAANDLKDAYFLLIFWDLLKKKSIQVDLRTL